MDNILVFLLLLVLILININNGSTEAIDAYVAAVVDYGPKKINSNPKEILAENLKNYADIVQQAKLVGADIIVFPEYGLTTTSISNHKNDAEPFSSIIPSVNDAPYNPSTAVIPIGSETIANISRIAQKHKIYIVVNLPEKELINATDYVLYNTNLIFDRNGNIISKYRKYNLYGEPAFTQPSAPDMISFKTDFGVTFGIFTCFDILFHEPAQKLVYDKNITDFIFPTAWMSELPFLSALQTQAGWARTHRVNLLASNYRNAENYFGGSGIYSSQNVLEFALPNDPVNSTKMIYGQVPKINRTVHNVTSQLLYKGSVKEYNSLNSAPFLRTKLDNLVNYSFTNIKSWENVRLFQGNFSCQFKVKFHNTSISTYHYKLVTYQGFRYMGETAVPVQVCGLVACLNDNISSCGKINYNATSYPDFPIFFEIEIEGNFANHKNTLVFPSTVTYDLHPLPFQNYTFAKTGSKTKMFLNNPERKLFTFAIYAHTLPTSGANLHVINVMLVLCIPVIYILK